MRVLISGGAGFVGANLVRRLSRDGHQIHVLARPQSDLWRLADLDVAPRIHTTADTRELKTLIGDIRPNWVFHLAAYGAYSHQTDTAGMIQTNLLWPIQFLESCLGVGFDAFIATGSSSEYGCKDHPTREDDLPEPNSPYAVTKLAFTAYCRYAAARSSANIKVLRLYSVFGPWEDPRRFLPRLITEAMDRRLPPLANPASAHDFVYVDDVCEALTAAASESAAGSILNVGSGVQTTLREAVEAVTHLLPVEMEPQWGMMDSRSWDTGTWQADVRRIQEELGWRPVTAFAVGVEKMIKWFCSRPEILAYYRSRFA